MPGSGEVVWLFGFESTHPPAAVETKGPSLRLLVRENPPASFAAEARHCIRHASGADIRYQLAEVADTSQPTRVAVRTIAVSPFAEDRGQAFYFGGFDCNSIPSHNTAWICRADWRR
jgi:hypothetical protein